LVDRATTTDVSAGMAGTDAGVVVRCGTAASLATDAAHSTPAAISEFKTLRTRRRRSDIAQRFYVGLVICEEDFILS
jgi:hypothetical protein